MANIDQNALSGGGLGVDSVAVPCYSYNRGVISLIDDSSNIDFLRKKIVENFNALFFYVHTNASVTYNGDNSVNYATVTDYPLRKYCPEIFGSVEPGNSNYITSLSDDYVEMKNLADNSIEFNDALFYYCGSLSQVRTFAQNGRVFTSQGYTVQGNNLGYFMASTIVADINNVIDKKCNFFKVFYEKLLQHNLQIVTNLSSKINAIDIEDLIYQKFYDYIYGMGKGAHFEWHINSATQDYLIQNFWVHCDKLVADFKAIKNDINTLKVKLESFYSYYDIAIYNKNRDYYQMPKYDDSNTEQFTGDPSVLTNDLNSLNDIYSSLKMPNSGNLRFIVSGKSCFSGSGLSNSISEIDNNLLGLKSSFEKLTNHVDSVIKGINSCNTDKSVDTLANEVIRGNWGVGAERKRKLEAAGYNYDDVQARVNQILLGTGAVVSTGTSSAVSNIINTPSSTQKPPTTQYRVEDTIDLEAAKKEYFEKLEKAQKDAEAKAAKLKAQQQKELENLRKQQDEKINKLKEQQAKDLEKLREQQKQQAISDSQKQQAIDKLKKEQASELEKLRQEQAKEAEKLKQQQAKDLEKIKQDSLNEITKLKQNAQNNNFIPNANVSSSNNSSNAIINDSTIESSDMGDSILDNNNNDSIFNVEEPSYITPKPNRVVQTSDKSGNAGVVGAVLGIGALGAAGIVGARYVKKKKENETYSDDENYFSDDEEFSEVKEEETEKSSSKYKAGSVNSLVLDDSSEIDTTNSNITNSDVLDFE